MQYQLIGPSLYMDKVGCYYRKENEQFIPVTSKEVEAENRYVQRHKGGNKK